MEALALAESRYTPASIAAGVTELVTLPAVYLEVRRIVNDPEAGIIDLAQAVANDVAISARLLRVVNSAAYRTFRSVGTISQAVNILGMQRVHELALASALASVFEGLAVADANMAGFWSRSVTCGAIARSLGEASQAEDMERLFVQGLLCEVGHLAMFQCAAPCVARVLEGGALTDLDIVEVERAVLGFDHAQVGVALLEGWNLPPAIIRAVGNHAAPLSAVDGGASDALACHVAWHAACSMATAEDLGERLARIDPPVRAALGLSPEAVAEAIERGVEDAVELQELFFPQLPRSA